MENLNPVTEFIVRTITNPPVVFLGVTTLLQISPIKINPWNWIFGKLGKAINSEMISKLDQVEKDISTIKKDREEDNADNMRCRILSFAGSCRRHEHHDAEEWNNIISQIKKYETYVKERHIDNGVIEETAVYLRELYHERLVNNDFD